MKCLSIVIIDGQEKELRTLPKEEQEELARIWNERALAAVGYERKRTLKNQKI